MSRLFILLIAIVGVGLALLVFNDSAGQTFGIENNRFASVVALSAFGVLLGAGLLARRVPMGDTVRHIALWLGLVVALVTGYTYRYEIQDAASRVSGGLITGSPLSVIDAEGRETVYVERAPGGHFEARVTVDGTPISMIVDTGASSTVLAERDARAIGIDPDALSYWVPVTTANGRTEAARIEAKEIAVGPIVRRDVTMLVARAGALEQSLLGMNFIGSLSGLDMRGSRLILRD